MPKRHTLSKGLFLRIAPHDLEHLEQLADLLPIASRNAIAREAMRIGMSILEKYPSRFLASEANTEREL